MQEDVLSRLYIDSPFLYDFGHLEKHLKNDPQLGPRWKAVFSVDSPSSSDLKLLLDGLCVPLRGRVKLLAEKTGFDYTSVSRMMSGARGQKITLRFRNCLRLPLLERYSEIIRANDNPIFTEKVRRRAPIELLIYNEYGGVKADIWKAIRGLEEDDAMEVLRFVQNLKKLTNPP